MGLMRLQLILLIWTVLFTIALSFVNKYPSAVQSRCKPLHENFFFDFAGDPEVATPRELYGEVAYKSFIAKTNPDGLLVQQYDLLRRVRETKVLSQLADSGLIEALETRGLTLSKIEQLLPLVDEFNLLPLLVKNKDLVLSLAPLLIEPAPTLLPFASKFLKTPPSTFLVPGIGLLGLGAFETVEGNLLGLLAIFAGLPAAGAGIVLDKLNFANIQIPATNYSPSKVNKSERPTVVATKRVTKKVEGDLKSPVVPSAAKKTEVKKETQTTSVVKVAPATVATTKKRKMVKIN